MKEVSLALQTDPSAFKNYLIYSSQDITGKSNKVLFVKKPEEISLC